MKINTAIGVGLSMLACGDKENDKTAVDTINGVYQSGLENLKKIAEAK